MRRGWKTIIGFAVLGLAIAAVCYAYAAFYDYSKAANGLDAAIQVVSLVLCPAQLFFAWCIDCEVVGRDSLVMYSIIGVLNTAIYTLVGFLVVALREKPDSPNGQQHLLPTSQEIDYESRRLLTKEPSA